MTAATFIGLLSGDQEVWTRGPALIVVPAIREEYPPELKQAIARRRSVVLEGRCPCGADMALRAGYVEIDHEAGCPAPDAPDLLAQWEASR